MEESTDKEIPVSGAGWTAAAAAVVALVGLGDSIYLTGTHFAGATVPCDLVTGCEKVLSSSYSEIAGIPLAAFGAIAYFIAFSLSVLVFFGHERLWKLFGAQAFLMAAFSAWLIYLQASVIGAFCQFCLISAASSTLLFILFIASRLKNLFAQVALVVVVIAGLAVAGFSIIGGGGPKKTGEAPSTTSETSLSAAPLGAEPPNRKGPAEADVVVEEFIDFQCDTCASKLPILKELSSEFGDRVAFIVRSFPIGDRKRAFDAASAAEAAGLQGKFWEMHDQLFSDQSDWSTADDHRKFFLTYATDMGLDIAKFRGDMDSPAVLDRIKADVARAQAAGVRSTPALFINGDPVSFDQFNKEALRQLLETRLALTAR